MIKILFPLLAIVLGATAGLAAGFYFKPPPIEDVETAEEKKDGSDSPSIDEEVDPKATRDYVKMANQFVVPVVKDEKVTALIALSLSIEVMPGTGDSISAREPKIRDSLLRVLFNYAALEGFDGAFTDGERLDALRSFLKEAAIRDGSESITDILILEIAKQEI